MTLGRGLQLQAATLARLEMSEPCNCETQQKQLGNREHGGHADVSEARGALPDLDLERGVRGATE